LKNNFHSCPNIQLSFVIIVQKQKIMAAIKHLFHIDAPRQKVYEAISTINGFQNWWTKQTSGDAGLGGVIAFRFGNPGMDFKVTKLTEATEVNMICVAGFDDWIGTTLTFFLDENEGKTRVRFTHDNWAETGDNYAACCFSWGR
jgi:uncharacterized protein YndB with AHSA1/START domain